MEREYRTTRESWQEVILLSISLCSYSERSQTYPPQPPHLLYLCFLCNLTPLSSPGSAIGHTAGFPTETHEADLRRPPLTWLDSWSVSQLHPRGASTSFFHEVPVAPEVMGWFADSWHKASLFYYNQQCFSLMLSLQVNRLAPWSSSPWEYSHCLHILGQNKQGIKVYTLGRHLAMPRHDHACHVPQKERSTCQPCDQTDSWKYSREVYHRVHEGVKKMTHARTQIFLFFSSKTCYAIAAHLPVVSCVLAVQEVWPKHQQEDRSSTGNRQKWYWWYW